MNTLCSSTTKDLLKAFGINAAVVSLYAGALYLEANDASLMHRVATSFANCISENITCAIGCNVTNWCQVAGGEHHIPGLPMGSIVVMPIVSSAAGIATGYIISKIRNTPLDQSNTCTVRKVLLAGLAISTAVIYPATIYFESQHLSVAQKVTDAISHCMNKVSCDSACDALNWCGIMKLEEFFPRQSLISAAIMTPLSWLSGFIGTTAIRTACAAKGRHQYHALQQQDSSNHDSD